MQSLNSTLLQSVKQIAQEAGEHLKGFYQRSVEIKIKADHTPVTEADLFISQFITEKLRQLTPNVPILSEENCNIPLEERQSWQEYWIIDPLDGTQQFIDRTDQFSVVIGLVQHNHPVLGVIHAPILAKTYFAMAGNGAFLQKNGEIRPLVGHQGLLNHNRLKIAMGASAQSKVLNSVNPSYQTEILQYGSSSLKAGLIAEGKVDCYVRFGDTGEWDTAVAEVLLAEVGGKIFDLNFEPLTYNQRPTFVNPHFVMVADKQLNWEKIFQFNS
ncbi:3'(2'),5'-bisphosphate nucleotidase CysQ [Actinobacillus equuli]|uniref:3'(2'),5'-bisphosphate nucleotidase CysQ n=1 Tax=Actinobacillus equuli TaxID=718 RepID=UPI00241837F0|nr:3'(2'),5'-bisphosphate nucleotidase CysQ [Actinobacillus equuli]MDG4951623.1 3'(2'),5'-bisphosphate nucleotidase CysQ [Actinobacillus equuli subsp. equuli]WGE46639.1 3'(2'),5'-bisphosphate nucleotidase CysQ [Actinobacillus equuli subsp. haemolyticus]WGE50826.1 3'(2'),5'-bisphosphate nucleotidase CysQ [Actinobacillus equuli subsp. haemolyticus]WGE59211.1 3'(2'),5'-bisphosphate nucleotidase CysQ [Actinobacillus equuli subsp. haemolyticus]WGE62148.1 3'(2'),5'-bisphosphate nucleotidase CysQ [Ac